MTFVPPSPTPRPHPDMGATITTIKYVLTLLEAINAGKSVEAFTMGRWAPIPSWRTPREVVKQLIALGPDHARIAPDPVPEWPKAAAFWIRNRVSAKDDRRHLVTQIAGKTLYYAPHTEVGCPVVTHALSLEACAAYWAWSKDGVAWFDFMGKSVAFPANPLPTYADGVEEEQEGGMFP